MGPETKVGAPCLAFLGDGWIKAKVVRENEDGTYEDSGLARARASRRR